ncbi:Non-receptor tyrosine-protein kinase TNK1 [Balamuthia mandrillaris]
MKHFGSGQRWLLCCWWGCCLLFSLGVTELQAKQQHGNYFVKNEIQRNERDSGMVYPGSSLCLLEPRSPSQEYFTVGTSGMFFMSADFLPEGEIMGYTYLYVDTTPPFGESVTHAATLTDLNGDGMLEVAVTVNRTVIMNSYQEEYEYMNEILHLSADTTPLSGFQAIQARTSDPAIRFGTSVTFLGDLDKNGVGEVAISAEYKSNTGTHLTVSDVHILYFNETMDVINVTTITLFPDISNRLSAFATMEELGVNLTRFGESISGLGDVNGDNVPDMAVTAYSEGGGGFVFILFLTEDGGVKDFRFYAPESVYQPPDEDSNNLWQMLTVKTVGNEAALTEAERFANADFNNDGVRDLIIVDALTGGTWIAFLDTSGGVSGNTYYSTGNEYDGTGAAIVGDLEEDGIPDIILSNPTYDLWTLLMFDAIRVSVVSASYEEYSVSATDDKTIQTTFNVTFQVQLSNIPVDPVEVAYRVDTVGNITDELFTISFLGPLIFDVGSNSSVIQFSLRLKNASMLNNTSQELGVNLVLESAVNALLNATRSSLFLQLEFHPFDASNESGVEKANEDNTITNVVVPVVVTVVVVLLFAVVAAGIGVYWRQRTGRKKLPDMEYSSQYNMEAGISTTLASNSKKFSSKQKWEIHYKELKFIEKIGEGAFGEVWRGLWRNSEVAIKKLRTMDDEQLQDFMLEAQTLKTLRPHGNVIRLLGIVKEDDKPFCIVTEFMDQGDLNSYLQKHKESITPEMMLTWAEDIAKGIIHRDLATRNLLLTNALHIKVADFGMSRKMQKVEEQQKTMNEVGPLKWMAPEAIEEQVYSEKSDVWSFGVCLWEIASFGAIPFEGLSPVNAAMGKTHCQFCMI